MIRFTLAAILGLASQALAADGSFIIHDGSKGTGASPTQIGDPSGFWATTPILKIIPLATPYSARETFRMQQGACLRGPMEFYGIDGEVIFSLQAGVEYPTDCGKVQK